MWKLLKIISVSMCFSIPGLALDPQKIKKINVVMIVIDDLRHLADTVINLPNIKLLARKGVSFENAYAQQALCAPSRNSMLTGRRPDALRLYDFYSYWRETVGNFTTLPQFFKEHGYTTYSVGKVFHPGKSSNYHDDYPYSWSHYPYHPPTEVFKDDAVCLDEDTKTLQKNLVCPVIVPLQPNHTLPDLETLDFAVNILRSSENRTEPYFLAVGFHKPHIPLKFPIHYLARIPMEKVRLPKQPNRPKNVPTVAWHPWSDVRHRDDIKKLNISFPFGTMPSEWTMKIRQSYYAAASYIDDLVGILIKNVNLKNTLVVLTSDHGWSLGENGVWAKYSNYDAALKVPLIFCAPGLNHKNIHTPVELIDIFPSIVDLTGLSNRIPRCTKNQDKTKLCFDGKSLAPLMKFRSLRKHFYAISQYPRPSVFPQINTDKPRLKQIKIMGYSIRTKQYRYTEWVSFNNTAFTRNWNELYGIELYDHYVDPDESKNVQELTQYKHIKQKLSKKLRHQIETNGRAQRTVNNKRRV